MPTTRATQKADRRAALLREAATLFAERGFAGVSTTDLGDAVGMTGPALYNYFPSKEALLAALLIDASERLLAGGRAIVERPGSPSATLKALIAFHLSFATTEPDVIRVQDRELATLPGDDSHRVRALQREYVQVWDGVLGAVLPTASPDERLTRLLATFGLLNSTPHSDRAAGTAALLATMAEAGLLAAAD